MNCFGTRLNYSSYENAFYEWSLMHSLFYFATGSSQIHVVTHITRLLTRLPGQGGSMAVSRETLINGPWRPMCVSRILWNFIFVIIAENVVMWPSLSPLPQDGSKRPLVGPKNDKRWVQLCHGSAWEPATAPWPDTLSILRRDLCFLPVRHSTACTIHSPESETKCVH